MEVHHLISTKTILLLTAIVLLINACCYIIFGQFHQSMVIKKRDHGNHSSMVCLHDKSMLQN